MAFHPMADVLQRILQLFLCADERMRAGRFGWVTTSFTGAPGAFQCLQVSLAQLLDNNPILTLRRDIKLLRGLLDGLLLVGGLNHAWMLGSASDDIDAPVGHSSHQRP
jgi:hypothetical protein